MSHMLKLWKIIYHYFKIFKFYVIKTKKKKKKKKKKRLIEIENKKKLNLKKI